MGHFPEIPGTSVPTLDAAACAGLADALTGIAAQAAKTVLALATGAGLRHKADGSPVTAADEAAESTICEGLRRTAPDLPVISEEQAALDKPRAIAHGSYFLVDPLDGTREFVAGLDEYTINIALVTDGTPLLGVVCAPALGLIWRGVSGRGAERLAIRGDGGLAQPENIRTRTRPDRDPVILVSRSHLDAQTKAFVEALPGAKRVACGSSLKFCRLAEAAADIYPRLAPTHDWDIAAGHALLVAAGGSVTAPDGGSVRYGTSELLIPGFIALADRRPITG